MHRRQRGIAMVLVMIVVALATVMGVAYLSTATMRMASSQNLLDATRARYLAESGVQHAVEELENDPALVLASSKQHPLGPFYADDSEDGYMFYCEPDLSVSGRYRLYGVGTRGQIQQTSSVTVFRGFGNDFTGGKSVIVANWPVTLTNRSSIEGDVAVAGKLINNGTVHGNVVYTGDLDNNGTIDGTITRVGPFGVMVPSLDWSDYKKYKLFDTQQHDACRMTSHVFVSTDPRAQGGAITAANPGGVVWMDPPRWTVATLADNLDFKGTIIVNGNLFIDGSNIKLEAADGFPSLVVNGKITVSPRANIQIKGLVYATGGIDKADWHDDTSATSVTIDGGLVSPSEGYHAPINGTFVTRYKGDRCSLYDVQRGNNRPSTVRLISWND